ncbi:spindle assembly abnormal protein 6 like protein [Ditylenchus destructor]|uniref:Spindle assembly abnormal protein 6 like protein n=1 Tax=Ditylenchus destructor TaxID=166010 RepID=A0AAD4QR48_9BILA|nr:spindle assembly abnormal protein 6 like protein [Ditylenchus destructor]
MTKEQFFDEEISVRLTNISGDRITPCSNIGPMLEKKVMLRINCVTTSDIQRKEFEVEVYDEVNVDFLYSGYFTSSKFSEIKQQQRVTFNIADAPQKITSFIQQARKDNDKYVSCTIQENSNVDKCICRFELISSNDFKNATNLSLELKKAAGEKLNHHLIKFIEKYKTKCDVIPSLKKQLEDKHMENKKLREEIKELKSEKDNKSAELNQEREELTEEIWRRTEEAKTANEEVEILEGNLKSVKYAYNDLVRERKSMRNYINGLKNDLYESEDHREDYRKRCKKLEEQVKECKDSLANYKNQLADCEKRFQLSEEEAKQSLKFVKHFKNELSTTTVEMEKCRSEKEKLAIEVEGLRTHVELLKTQLKTSEERKSLIVKNRLFKQT